MLIVYPAHPLMFSHAGVTSLWYKWAQEFEKHDIAKGLFDLNTFRNVKATSRHMSGQIAQDTGCGEKFDCICNGWTTTDDKVFENASKSYINKYAVSGETTWIKPFAQGLTCFLLSILFFIFLWGQKRN